MSDEQSQTDIARWKFEQDRQIAERVHDSHTQFAEKLNFAAIENANIALRTLILINGGAAIAILAFFGGIIAADTKKYLYDITQLTSPIVWFVWGVAFATLAMGFAYATNYCIATAIGKHKHEYKHPYIKKTKSSKRWHKSAVCLQIWAMGFAFGSLICFLVGMYSVRNATTFSTEIPTISKQN